MKQNHKKDKKSILISIASHQTYDKYFSSQKNLLSNMDELNFFLENGNIIIFVLYFFKTIIAKILYDNDEVIYIKNSYINKSNISDYFFISLLIKEDPNIINYTYSKDIINDLKKLLLKNEPEKKISKIIISKIGIDLLNNYKNTDNYDESESEELINMEKEFYNIIKNNINESNFNLNYTITEIISEKIDLIYIGIILNLIKQRKMENYEYTLDVLKQMDFENIKLTKNMIDKLNELFEDKNILNYYQIRKPIDLSNETKINFYYFLLKYILKDDSLLIYQNALFINTKRSIIEMIKTNKITMNNLDEKSNTIINNLVGSNYYIDLQYKKYTNIQKSNNECITNDITYTSNIVSNYISDNHLILYNNNEDLKDIKDNMTLSDYEEFMKKILNNSSFLIISDEEKKMSISILNEKDEIQRKTIKRKRKIKKIENDFNNLLLNFKKFIDFISNAKEEIEKKFNKDYNLIIKMKFNQEDINNSNGIYNITCKYIYFPLNEEKLSSFVDENILVNGPNQGFPFLINEINDYNYSKIKYNKYLDINKVIKEKESIEEEIRKKEKGENIFSIFDIVNSEEVSEYTIIRFKKIIAIHSNSVDYLYKLSNGYYISGGNQREVFIYDQNFNKIEVYLKHKPIGICEIKYHDNKNILKIIAYSYECLSLISYETYKNNRPLIQIYTISASHLLQIDRNKYVINNVKSGYISDDFSVENNFKKIFKYTYYAGIKINEKLSAFTSNRIMPNGKDRLIIYNIISNEIVYELEGYSFSLSQNSLLLIKIENSLNKDKILICACKKYSSYQKNGILLVNTIIDDNQDIFDGFYETYNFEPYCLSQILLVNKSYENNKKSRKIYDTNYFFVGGFDQEKGIGAIKLYKINFEYQVYNTTISFIQDIIFDEDKNFEGFDGPITSIIQTNDTGNFLISCYNGYVYLFSPANLNYFLFYDDIKESDYEKMKYFDKGIQSQIENEQKSQKLKFDNNKMFDKLVKFLEKNYSFKSNL